MKTKKKAHQFWRAFPRSGNERTMFVFIHSGPQQNVDFKRATSGEKQWRRMV